MSGWEPDISISAEVLAEVRALHAEVDTRAAALTQKLGAGLVCCPGCSDCCVDGLKVFPIEAALIQANSKLLLENTSPHPSGRCSFLDEHGSCQIYALRPYVCRTQGLPLRWLQEDSAGEVVELRDICPLNDQALQNEIAPLEDLSLDQFHTLGFFEERLASIQASLTGFSPNLPRISLRSLFL